MTEAVYHCDLGALRGDHHAVRQVHNQEKLQTERRARALERLTEPVRENTRAACLYAAMHDHLLKHCRAKGAGSTLSFEVPARSESALLIGGVADVTNTPVGRTPLLLPALTPHRSQTLQWIAADNDDDILAPDSDATPPVPVDEDGAPNRIVLFKVVHARAGTQRLMAVSAAVGRRLKLRCCRTQLS